MNLRIKEARAFGAPFALTVLLAMAFAIAACGDGSGATPSSTVASATGAAMPTPLKGDITVLAAASLTDAFKEAGKAFETANPGVRVTFSFAASSALVTQIDQGQPGDVFASADGANMKKVTDKNQAANPVVFATNVPVLVVPASGAPVSTFEDLAKPGVKLVLAAPSVPIGNYARQTLANASSPNGGIAPGFSDQVLANLKSNETDVRAVLAKVQLGEADAGIVYTTDAAIAKGDVKTIAIPEKYNVVAQYPIAALAESKHKDVAGAFIAFITSDTGQALMQKHGFGRPALAAVPAATVTR